MKEIIGKIHSIESCGTVDGPGIRFVIFLQGCPMRCLYCHNPDTWDLNSGTKITVQEIFEKYNGVKEFCKGGITVTGGEPLVQIDFVTEIFKEAKNRNINTALDTSGILFNPENTDKIDLLLKYTDLVLLDIKHIDNDKHEKLTKHSNKNILEFAKFLSVKNIPIWIRHVVVPTITDTETDLFKLGQFIGQLRSVKALDILPYHNMAEKKYESLNIKYPLKGIKPLTKDEAIKARDIIIRGMKNTQ